MPIYLEKKVAGILTQTHQTLSLAESCTGGLLAHRLTNIPGSSNFLKAGLIVYSYESKTRFLKVSPALLKKHGAVSPAVAGQMAKAVRKILDTDFSIGITGIAGPAGGTKTKPVGLVYIALASSTGSKVKRYVFKGSRASIKKSATDEALKLLLQALR